MCGAQQKERVQIVEPTAKTPVETRDQAVRRSVGLEGAQPRADGDHLALPDRGGDGEVGGPQPVGVVDRDHASPADGSREPDGARTCRENRTLRRQRQVGAPVPGQPRSRWR
ncbi:hypothetical protein GCM10009560_72590 [Nonomuraea longicatena]|uniref:Uncharacterized protein n=1 Tax=Nonomuraea longicatena TaxID=83682 RepID=A0ABN1R482_9ACTN